MLLFIFGFVVLVVVLSLAARVKAHPPLPMTRRAIAHLDLDPVRQKAAERYGWTPEAAQILEDSIAIFCSSSPSTREEPYRLGPTRSISSGTNTARYAADCQRIFGRFIQHDPHIDKDPERRSSTIKITTLLREAQLRARATRLAGSSSGGKVIARDGFDVATWGCGNVDALYEPIIGEVGSHSRGGDHSAGGHGGGHSCGGHGCGGHGGDH
jgi:hypothetical protein